MEKGIKVPNYRLPVVDSKGIARDIYGYKECYDAEFAWGGSIYFRMADDSVVVIGKDQRSFPSWTDVENTVIPPCINQSVAREHIEENGTTKLAAGEIVTKELRDVYLTNLGNVFGGGDTIFPAENYTGAVDIFSWGNYGRYYVFALKKDGTICQVAAHGSTEFAYRNLQTVRSILEWTDVRKVSQSISVLAALKNDGTILLPELEYGRLEDAPLWKNVIDISAQHKFLVAKTGDGKTLFDKTSGGFISRRYEKMPFDLIAKGEHYYESVAKDISFSGFEQVVNQGHMIYGFNKNGEIQICDLLLDAYSDEPAVHRDNMLFGIERLLCTDYRTYLVGADRSTYKLDISKEGVWVEKIDGMINPKEIITSDYLSSGYISEDGIYHCGSSDPYRTGVDKTLDMADYAAILFTDGSVEIVGGYDKDFKLRNIQGGKKYLFFDSHVLILYKDGSVGYTGRNKNRCCSGLSKYTNITDIEGTDTQTILTLEDGKKVFIPRKK